MLAEFLSAVFRDGVATLPNSGAMTEERSRAEHDSVIAVLRRRYELVSPTLVDPVPDFDPEIAGKAARGFASLCLLFAGRSPVDFSDDVWSGFLASPATLLSADLTLSYLPDLLRLVRAARGDGDESSIVSTAIRRHPLLPSVLNDGLPVIWGDPCLRMLYLDRVIAADDDEAAAEPCVAAALAELFPSGDLLPRRLAARRAAADASPA